MAPGRVCGKNSVQLSWEEWAPHQNRTWNVRSLRHSLHQTKVNDCVISTHNSLLSSSHCHFYICLLKSDGEHCLFFTQPYKHKWLGLLFRYCLLWLQLQFLKLAEDLNTKSLFLILALLTVWVGWNFIENCPVHCMKFSSIPGFYPLDARSTNCLPLCVTTKNISKYFQRSPGCKSATSWEPVF